MIHCCSAFHFVNENHYYYHYQKKQAPNLLFLMLVKIHHVQWAQITRTRKPAGQSKKPQVTRRTPDHPVKR